MTDDNKLKKHIRLYEDNIANKVFGAIASITAMKYPAIIVEVKGRMDKGDLYLLNKVLNLKGGNPYSLYLKTERMTYIGSIEYTASNLNILVSTFKKSTLYLMENEIDGFEINKDKIMEAIVIK